jgi:hypothetical protein
MALRLGSPSFGEAVQRFKDFLRSQHWPEDIRWFRADDFGRAPGGPITIVREPDGDGCGDAMASYEQGRRANLGVSFEAVCTFGGATCAIVGYPADAREAELLMYPSDGSLKLSAALPRTEALRR